VIGGIRHLIWDFGYGMEPGTRMNMAARPRSRPRSSPF
jgi:succinate dehydrogenase/fumarate reductase cytochrome b subunit